MLPNGSEEAFQGRTGGGTGPVGGMSGDREGVGGPKVVKVRDSGVSEERFLSMPVADLFQV